MEVYLAEYASILSLDVLALNDLNYEPFAAVFVHCFQGSLAQALEELVLLNLTIKALCFENFSDDALAVSFLREVEYKFDSLGEFDGYGVYCEALADLAP